MKIEIKSAEIIEKRGTSLKGKAYCIREQIAYIDLGKAYPVEIKIGLQDSQPPFNPGLYEINSKCFFVKSFGQVAVDLTKITPRSTLNNARTA